jgi:hypothetical protein
MAMLRFLPLFFALCLASQASAHFPTGAMDFMAPEECQPENIWNALSSPQRSLDEVSASLQERISRCDPYWHGEYESPVMALAKLGLLRYPVSQPYLRKIQIPLPDGRRLRGTLAIKPGAHDLVVVRCGMFCNDEGGPTGPLAIMNLFEENPVHLLLLNSNTGLDFAQDNGLSYVGPFDEGFQNLQAGKYIFEKQAELGLKIRDLRIVGMSLGGLSALYSSVYFNTSDEFLYLRVNSFLALCPLVDT